MLMAITLVLNLGVAAMGAEKDLEIADVPLQKGQTAYVAVVLNASAVGDSIGVTYSYDKSVLEALPSSATWGKQGLLQDFNRQDSGVWAAAQPQDLQGTVCVLAFRVKDGAALTKTTVSCTVTIKNDTENLGTFTAEGMVYAVCSHSFGNWTEENGLVHSHKCSLCGEYQNQSHTWNKGSLSDHPSNTTLQILTQTCEECGATKTTEVSRLDSVEIPTNPSVEKPTEAPEEPEIMTMPPQTEPPVTRPTEPSTDNKGDTGTKLPSGNQNNSNNQDSSGNQNNSNNQNNSGSQSKPEINDTAEDLKDYNNPSSGSNQNSSGNKNPSGNKNESDKKDPDTEKEQSTVPADEENEGHDHSHEDNTRPPIAVPAPGVTETPTEPETVPQETDAQEVETLPIVHDEHDHDHVHEEPAPVITGTSVLALVFAVALVALAGFLTTVLFKRLKK